MTGPLDGDHPTRELPSQPPGGAAPPTGLRRLWSRVPHHLGRVRTSTVVLAVLFLAIGTLYLYVRPDVPSTGTAVAPTGRTTAPATTAPATTAPREPTETSEPTAPTTPRTTSPDGTTTSAPEGTPTEQAPTETPERTTRQTPEETTTEAPTPSAPPDTGTPTP
ncbi:hypothetical protein [Geodermatophilus sp. TF02-6]|uniref:hypothetical protein n=1 Tax=Geodermatophilus sp. TF02-6 TaxID=2250575 RepID=UPI000DEBDD7D|nr:hypothetical protein [Geodermatophilus sp. TF02-6]